MFSIVRTLAIATAIAGCVGAHAADRPEVGKSPWGAEDQIGRLNLMTDASRAAVLSRIAGGRVYDLSVEYFIGMPGWHAAGDPRYQMWMTHTPHGTVVDDPIGVGHAQNEHVSYTGSAVSMYTHTGTHIDALNHFGLDGRIWNGFEAREHLGDRGWRKTGAETIPPIVARGVLIDVAAAQGMDMLPPGYRVKRQDLLLALRAQQISLRQGDVVLIRTGRMKHYGQPQAFMDNPPGMSLDAARFLVEEGGAMVVGADNLSFETFPPEVDGNYVPVHTYLLAQQGAPIMELVQLEELARDRVYEFAFIGASLKLKGADAAPMRPIAIALRR
ncbi:cyclase family protein [uncultured Azohydromonas sp.]|jgi:Predicted metal-dependent hydrolase|uniref:cyclase family protein n=1 Tax=uncultured Azohydromonas sp. TaxID=487342 RepID=UPI0026143CAC|nr:cyclase family protein [uncultured Azohydromonas sp.]